MGLDDAIQCLDLLGVLPPATVDRSHTIEGFVTTRGHPFISSAIEGQSLSGLLLDEEAVPHAS